METINAFFDYVAVAPFDMNVRYSLFYLACSIVIAFGIWLYRGRPETFIKWLVPAAFYRHKSNILDIKLFLASRAFMAFGVFSAVFFPTTVAYTLLMKKGGTNFARPRPVAAAYSLPRSSS